MYNEIACVILGTENMTEHQFNTFILAVLYNLEEKWRGIGTSSSFQEIVNNQSGVSIHKAFLQLKEEGLLGKFSELFFFDPLYGTSNITRILSTLAFNQSIRADGTFFHYHLDRIRTKLIMDQFLPTVKIPKKLVLRVAKRLNELLDEQEKQSPAL